MMLEIPGLLNEAQLKKIDEILFDAEFVDGKLTAGMAAQRVKNNEELKKEPQKQDLLVRILMASLSHNEDFKAAALPAKMADPIFARYQPGMTYGDHVDDPIMGSGQKFRTDVSMTVFLRDPEAYEGGELVVRTSFGTKKVKMPAGGAVVYPSSSLHYVAPVTSGERLVALFWMQSHVRDPAKRELLFELNKARNTLLKERPEEEASELVDKSFANLMRMWADV
ncbi:Fe2+-dependent dioxygenase [Solemya velesiana gill symbiont]|uniref:Fe2+-dependent dioxygenase n=1 Tax=Solemya velesiana gill symbiont TaxID=1918948 RepID=A0A1T2KXC1_9GAMM|nr:Fe2+-dependent dioxygenase [Solemya velesiana gill symbiont]OOZ37483.1 Fe2+-dependent dioxygenase [Solemya velesiana gill symbiont]